MEFQKEKKSCVKKIFDFFEPIKGCKHPLIALGATPIGSAGRAPDEIEKEEEREEKIVFLSL
jgi:hypothetical protein